MPAGLIAGLGAGIASLGVAGTAAAASAVVTAGTAIAGAVGQSGDVSSGQSAANAAQTGAYDSYAANEQPYITSGQSALGSLGNVLGLNGADATSAFQGTPGFQFAEQQGLSAVDNGAASTGTLRTGNTVRAEENFATGLADQNYNQYVGQLSSLASLGQSATSALGGAGVATGAGIASTATSDATAQSNILANTTKSVGGAVSGLAGNQSVQNALSGLGSSSTSGMNVGAGSMSIVEP